MGCGGVGWGVDGLYGSVFLAERAEGSLKKVEVRVYGRARVLRRPRIVNCNVGLSRHVFNILFERTQVIFT